jgi:hypothetical protein
MEEPPEDADDIEGQLKERDELKTTISRRRIRPGNMHNPRDTVRSIQEEKIKNGDYVYSIGWQGVYVNGGVVWDPYEWWDPNKDQAVFGDDNDWREESLANGSIVKCRNLSGTTYFSKGILHELGSVLRDRHDVNVVFVNSTLTSMQ